MLAFLWVKEYILQSEKNHEMIYLLLPSLLGKFICILKQIHFRLTQNYIVFTDLSLPSSLSVLYTVAWTEGPYQRTGCSLFITPTLYRLPRLSHTLSAIPCLWHMYSGLDPALCPIFFQFPTPCSAPHCPWHTSHWLPRSPTATRCFSSADPGLCEFTIFFYTYQFFSERIRIIL